jgi:hypothetical protein
VFDGYGDVLVVPDHAALRLGTNIPFVVELVFAHTSSLESSWAGGNLVLSKVEPGWPFPGIALVANRPLGGQLTERLGTQIDIVTAATTPPGSYNDGTPLMLGMYRPTEVDLELRLNGSVVDRAISEGDITDVSAEGFDLVIGGRASDGLQAMQGVISEIVVARDVTEDDVHKLETYLRKKYESALLSR